MAKVYWYCLGDSKKDEEFLTHSLAELSHLLARPPVGIYVTFEPHLSSAIRELDLLSADPAKSWSDYGQVVFGLCGQRNLFRILIYCNKYSSLAMAARKKCTRAKWGLTETIKLDIDQWVYWGAVYEPNKYIIWHESLHLLGAEDCYAQDDLNVMTCERRNCIMQYAPTEQTVGDWPFLCSRNTKILQR